MNLPQPTPEQLAEAHRHADDAGRMARAMPPAEVWQREFPKEYNETPDGKWTVDYRHPGLSKIEAERNSQKMQAMIREWCDVGHEVSMHNCAQVPTVRVRRPSGAIEDVPVGQELTVARKGSRPVIRWGRATRYMRDEAGRMWKRPPHGEWMLDEKEA